MTKQEALELFGNMDFPGDFYGLDYLNKKKAELEQHLSEVNNQIEVQEKRNKVREELKAYINKKIEELPE